MRTTPQWNGSIYKCDKIKFHWQNQILLDDPVLKYELQIQEKYSEWLAHSNQKNPIIFNRRRSNRLYPDIETVECQKIKVKPWRTVYLNVANTCKCDPPQRGIVEWACRVRALNTNGWSNYSDVLILNCKTHSNIFLSDFKSSTIVEGEEETSGIGDQISANVVLISSSNQPAEIGKQLSYTTKQLEIMRYTIIAFCILMKISLIYYEYL